MGSSTPHSGTNEPAITHAGGIVFRKIGASVEYLLVLAKNPPDAWVFPKGHIEPGESAEQAAEREVLEEAGIRAKIVAPLGLLRLDKHGAAAVFLMTETEGGSQIPERETVWLEFDNALGALAFEGSKEMLTKANLELGR